MALLFDAVTEQVAVPTLRMGDVNTIGALVYPTDETDANHHFAFQKSDVGGRRWMLGSDAGNGGGNAMRCRFNYDGDDLNYFTTDDPLIIDQWQFVFFVSDAALGATDRAKFYWGDLDTAVTRDTNVTDSEPTGSPESTSEDLLFCLTDFGPADPFIGRVACVWAWPGVALTLGQLQAIQHKTVPTVAGCEYFSHWHAGQAADWSGQGNNGTITGATQVDHVPLGPQFGNDEDDDAFPLLFPPALMMRNYRKTPIFRK